MELQTVFLCDKNESSFKLWRVCVYFTHQLKDENIKTLNGSDCLIISLKRNVKQKYLSWKV